MLAENLTHGCEDGILDVVHEGCSVAAEVAVEDNHRTLGFVEDASVEENGSKCH